MKEKIGIFLGQRGFSWELESVEILFVAISLEIHDNLHLRPVLYGQVSNLRLLIYVIK